MGPISEMESVSINRTAARLLAGQGMTQSARMPAGGIKPTGLCED
jgi:hypothetical protein